LNTSHAPTHVKSEEAMAVKEIPLNQFLLDMMRISASGDGYALEKLFFQERRKIRFPKIERSYLDVSTDIDSISFTSIFYPFKAGTNLNAIKIHLYPNQWRNIQKDTGVTYPHLNTLIPLKNFKHFVLAEVGLFAGYIFFPCMGVKEKNDSKFSNRITNQKYYTFIEDILLKCIKDCHRIGTYPDNVKTKNEFKGRSKSNFNSILLDAELFPKIVQNARELIKRSPELLEFNDFFFHFQAIGLKNLFKSNDKNCTIIKLWNFVKKYVNRSPDLQAYYDVGIEFSRDQTKLNDPFTILWTKEGSDILRKGLGNYGKNISKSEMLFCNDIQSLVIVNPNTKKKTQNWIYCQFYQGLKNSIQTPDNIMKYEPQEDDIAKKNGNLFEYLDMLSGFLTGRNSLKDYPARFEIRTLGHELAFACLAKANVPDVEFIGIPSYCVLTYMEKIVQTWSNIYLRTLRLFP